MAQLSFASIRRAVPHSWIEGFAGSASVALYLMGGEAPSGYAGNKRFPAPRIAGMLWPYAGMPEQIVLAEVGPWRTVWEVFSSRSGGGAAFGHHVGLAERRRPAAVARPGQHRPQQPGGVRRGLPLCPGPPSAPRADLGAIVAG